MPAHFLSLDNGGTNTKAILFDADGRQLAAAAFPTPWVEPGPGFREIDLDQLRDSLFSVVRSVLDQAGVEPASVKAVSCVGHGKGLYLLDRAGQVFHRGILSTDGRARALAAAFERRVEDIYAVSAQHVMPSQAPVLLRWLKDKEPEVYGQIGSILSAKDFVRFLLTGEIAQEIGDASGNNLVNLHTRAYDDRLLDFFGIPEVADCRPALIEPDTVAGSIGGQVAAATGLAAGTPVVGGLFDIDAGTLACGVLDSTRIAIVAGTWNINVYPAPAPVPLTPGIMNSLFLDGTSLVEASSPTSAGNLNLASHLLTGRDKPDFDELECYLDQTDASSCHTLFFPFLYGSNSDPFAAGSFIGLDSTTSRLQLLRSVYEGIAFAHQQHIEQLVAVRQALTAEEAAAGGTARTAIAGPALESVRLTGGASASPAWMQLFADVLELPVETLDCDETTGLGGAIVAAAAVGEQASLPTAVENMVRVRRRYQPDPVESAHYRAKYAIYRDFLDRLDGHWEPLAALAETK